MSTTPIPNGLPVEDASIPEDHTTTGYTLWAVLRRDGAAPAGHNAESLSAAVAVVEGAGVTVRGFYDVSSLRADADLMIWLHGGAPETPTRHRQFTIGRTEENFALRLGRFLFSQQCGGG